MAQQVNVNIFFGSKIKGKPFGSVNNNFDMTLSDFKLYLLLDV